MPNPWNVGDTFRSDGIQYRVTAAGPDWCRCQNANAKSGLPRRALIFDYNFAPRIQAASIPGAREPGIWWHDIPAHMQREITRQQDEARRGLLCITGGAMGQSLPRGTEITLNRDGTSRTLAAESSLGYLVVAIDEQGTLWVEPEPAKNAGNKAHEPSSRFDRELEIDDA